MADTTPAAAAGDGGDARPDQGVVAADKTYTAQEVRAYASLARRPIRSNVRSRRCG